MAGSDPSECSHTTSLSDLSEVPDRPVRPPNWKEANRLKLVQPGGRTLELGPMRVRVASVLADVRRTYIELRWTPLIKIRMFLAQAALTDAMGNAIERHPQWDAGENNGTYFIGYGPLPPSATHAILMLSFKTGHADAVVTLRIDPRLRARGVFDVPLGSTLTVLGHRFEVIHYSGGCTEGAVSYRFQCGAADWPVRIDTSLVRQFGAHGQSLTSAMVPDTSGRIESEFVVDGPTEPLQQTLRLQRIHAFPLAEPVRLPHPETNLSVRTHGVLVPLNVLWTDDGTHWRVRIRSPHVSAGSQLEVRGMTHPVLWQNDACTQPTEDEVQHFTAGSERLVVFPRQCDAPVLELRGMNLAFDPAPVLRLSRG